MPPTKAIFTLALPTIISQLITVVYNMADTFFIGQLNDPKKVAAVTLAMPAFMAMVGISNLFGIGGSSVISRHLGAGEKERAKECSAFSIWTAGAFAVLWSVILITFHSPILNLLGCGDDTKDYCYSYLFWTVGIGALPTVMSAVLAHLIRSEGYSSKASFGIVLGGIMNIALDPIFILALNLGVTGAAIATALSNCIALSYFIITLIKIRPSSALSISPKDYTLAHHIPFEVLTVGFPSFIMFLMGILSNTILNTLVASYSSEAIAGMGIAKKIDMLAFAVANGMTQGVLSLVGYNYASNDRKRMNKVIKLTFAYTLIISVAAGVFLFTCAAPVSRFFIDNAETVAYGQYFLRVICLTCPTIAVTFIIITVFQATGKKLQPMILSLIRKGGFDIPLMLVLNRYFSARGIAWATPLSDILAMSVALLLFIPYLKKISKPQ